MTKRRKAFSLLSIAGVLLAGTVGLLLLSSFKAEASKSETAVEARLVRTVPLYVQEQQVSILSDGFLEAGRSVEILSPVSGRVIESADGLKGGLRVEEGDVLLRLDDRRYRLAFESARDEAVRITTQFVTGAGLNADERERWNRYLGSLSASNLDELPRLPPMDQRLSLLATTMGVTGARQGLESAALDVADHRFVAPFAGVISGEGIDVGSFINAGQPVAILSESDRLDLRLAVNAKDLPFVGLGDPVELHRDDSGLSIVGEVVRIEPVLKAGSQTAQVHVTVSPEDPSLWLPGSFVTARIVGRTFPAAYRVPRGSLYGDRLPVYRQGRLELISVRILARDSSDLLLAPDFPEGTEMVETILQTPVEGMALRKGNES